MQKKIEQSRKLGAALALTIFTAQTLSLPVQAQDASGRQAKDFTHRKKFIVPSSENSRRIDYQGLAGRDSLMMPNYVPKFPQQRATAPESNSPYASGLPSDAALTTDGGAMTATAGTLETTNKPGIKPMTKTSRAGLVPPAPPVKNSLLPASLTAEPPKSLTQPKSAAAAATAAPPLSSARVAQIKAEALALVKKGKSAEAQTLLSGYVKAHPQEHALSTELSKISLSRAQALSKAGNHEAATKQARLAIIHSDNAPEVTTAANNTLNSSLSKTGVQTHAAESRLGLASKLMGEARYDEAEVEYRAAAKIKPSVDAYMGAGGAAMKGGRQLQAKTFFQDALELNPDSQPALKELGIARYHLKDYVGANADLTRALVLNSSDQEAAHALLDLWHKQVASRPQDANSHLGLARAYQVVGDLPSAQAEYKTVVQIHPQHPNLPAARQSFKLAFARQEAKKSFDMAHALEIQGAIGQAYQKASDAVGLYPSEIIYQNYRAELSARLQNGGPVQVALNTGIAPPQALIAQPAALVQTDTTTQTTTTTLSEPVSTLVPGNTGEAPPVLSLPTAQAVGIAPDAAAIASTATTTTTTTTKHSTDQHVSSLSNLMVNLRNLTMQAQSEAVAAETVSPWAAIGKTVSPIGGTFGAVGGASGLPLDEEPPAATLPLPGATATTTVVQSTHQSAAASALSAAANALANTRGVGPVPNSTTAAVTSAAIDASSAATATGGTALPSARFANAANMAALAAPAVISAGQKMAAKYQATAYDQAQVNSLQSSNQQLQAQLSQANSYIQQLKNQQMVPANNQYVQQNVQQTALQNAPQLNQPQFQAQAPVQQQMQPTGSMKLLLQGVKASKDDVQLKVMLRNETQQDIKLPSSIKALVRSNGQSDKQGKASFAGKTLAAGATVMGTIKIPGVNLDPTADVFIPASALAVVGVSDIHLTVPISQK